MSADGWALPAGILPRSWSHYTVPAGMTAIQWVSDFSERVKQLQNVLAGGRLRGRQGAEGEGSSQGRSGLGRSLLGRGRPPSAAASPQNIHVCLGGLFVPEAYITATRQYVPSQQLVPGGALPGGERHHLPERHAWTPAASGSPVSGGTPAWLPQAPLPCPQPATQPPPPHGLPASGTRMAVPG